MPKDELEKLIADVKRKLKRQGRGSAVQLAVHLGVSRSDLNYWLNQGREPGYRMGSKLRTWADAAD